MLFLQKKETLKFAFTRKMEENMNIKVKEVIWEKISKHGVWQKAN